MNDDGKPRMGRWVLRIWTVFGILWLLSLLASLTGFGGFTSPVHSVGMVLGGISCLLGLSLGWQWRREERARTVLANETDNLRSGPDSAHEDDDDGLAGSRIPRRP